MQGSPSSSIPVAGSRAQVSGRAGLGLATLPHAKLHQQQQPSGELREGVSKCTDTEQERAMQAAARQNLHILAKCLLRRKQVAVVTQAVTTAPLAEFAHQQSSCMAIGRSPVSL
jgi:hypothetical protein